MPIVRFPEIKLPWLPPELCSIEDSSNSVFLLADPLGTVKSDYKQGQILQRTFIKLERGTTVLYQ
ncbi:hypothetical protein B9Z19DRAFT_1070432 [Tuber borchii]|uniref:Uncharacterized protein n=1 Tax=Tuber borchii TaxID=42251 RepID=A0A2T7A911_TUBBO|nr:hypothetical protein B9Z19DRAFT_1070432 [Tuber borchii]